MAVQDGETQDAGGRNAEPSGGGGTRDGRRRLEALLLEGLASGGDGEVTPQYWAEVRDGIRRRLAERNGR